MCVSWQHHARTGKSDRVHPLQFRKSSIESCHPKLTWTSCRAVLMTSWASAQDAVGSGMLGLLMCLALVYPASCLVRGMVEEKETRMRETMCALLSTQWAAPQGRARAGDRNRVLRGLMHRALLACLLRLCVRAVLSQCVFGVAWSAARPTRRGGAHAQDPMPAWPLSCSLLPTRVRHAGAWDGMAVPQDRQGLCKARELDTESHFLCCELRCAEQLQGQAEVCISSWMSLSGLSVWHVRDGYGCHV